MATKHKTFKDYYNSDPAFRERHLTKIKEKIACSCGFSCARCNLSRHHKSHLHVRNLENIKVEKMKKITELKERISRLDEEVDYLDEEIEKVK